jgi:hypothetical protein
MSVTFYVDGWAEQPSKTTYIPLVEQYTSLSNDDFDGHGYDKNADGLYVSPVTIYEDAFPELNVANSTCTSILKVIGLRPTDCGSGEISVVGLDAVISACFRAKNVPKILEKGVVPAETSGNMIGFGVPSARLERKIEELHQLLIFAKIKGKMVYWC